MIVSLTVRSLVRSRCLSVRALSTSLQKSTDAMPLPNTDASADKTYPPKITAIVDQISQLNLLEVADLNELLKVNEFLKVLQN